ERFLNPERVSMPAFDIDFCMDRRDEVIDYVAARYGRDRVSQVITYGTMAAKAVLRDAGRGRGPPYGSLRGLPQAIPPPPAAPASARSSPTAPWPPRRCCATPAACSAIPTASSTGCPS